MNAKPNPYAAAPALMKRFMDFSEAINGSLEPSLAELVKIRSSQINQCANCINMHTIDARAHGETEQRIALTAAWREAPCFTDRASAALACTGVLTKLSEGHAQESVYDALAAHFTPEEQVKLTMLINVINGWNRVAVGFGMWMDYKPAKAAA